MGIGRSDPAYCCLWEHIFIIYKYGVDCFLGHGYYIGTGSGISSISRRNSCVLDTDLIVKKARGGDAGFQSNRKRLSGMLCSRELASRGLAIDYGLLVLLQRQHDGGRRVQLAAYNRELFR